MCEVDLNLNLKNLYLREFVFCDGEYDITFHIVDINLEKMWIKLARNHTGKISILEYDLYRDKNNNLFIRYGVEHSKIHIEDFEEIID